jgi:hypothetical protein
MSQLLRTEKLVLYVQYQPIPPVTPAAKSFVQGIFSNVRNAGFGFAGTVSTCTTPKATGLIPILPPLWPALSAVVLKIHIPKLLAFYCRPNRKKLLFRQQKQNQF